MAFNDAYDALNASKGPCHTTSFSVVGDDGTDRVYRDSDTLSIEIAYDAPGCVEATLTFGGYHVNGSPWATHYCRPKGCAYGGIGSNIFAERLPLEGSTGTLRFVALPGTFPPVDVGSPANLEGFQLCAVVVGFNDGQPDGSNTSDQLNFDTQACTDRP